MNDTSFVVTQPDRLAAAYRDGETKAVRIDDRGDVVPLDDGVPVDPRRQLDAEAYPSGGSGVSGKALDYLRFLEALRTRGWPVLNPESAASTLSATCAHGPRAKAGAMGSGRPCCSRIHR